MLNIRWGRIDLDALVAEAVPIVALVGLVAAFDLGQRSASCEVAER